MLGSDLHCIDGLELHFIDGLELNCIADLELYSTDILLKKLFAILGLKLPSTVGS